MKQFALLLILLALTLATGSAFVGDLGFIDWVQIPVLGLAVIVGMAGSGVLLKAHRRGSMRPAED